jgi:hypothetical protein
MNKIILVFIVFLLAGCDFDNEKTVYSLRVQQYHCLNGFMPSNPKHPSQSLKCNGSLEHAGILYIKLYPAERIGIVRVVSQDPNNSSANVYPLTNCDVYDGDNWSCYREWIGKDTFIAHYVQDGVFSLEYGPTVTGTNSYYSGIVHTGFVATLMSWIDSAIEP